MKKNIPPEKIIALSRVTLERRKNGQKNPLKTLKRYEYAILSFFTIYISFIIYLWI